MPVMQFDLTQDFPVGLDRLWSILGRADYIEAKYRSLGSTSLRLLKFKVDPRSIDVEVDREVPVARGQLPLWARVFIGDEHIPARTVVWAAGVAASPVARSLGVELDRAGRVLVAPDLTVPGHEDLFVVGDLASVKGDDGKPVPGLAPAAMQMGKQAAVNIRRRLEGKPMQPFKYWDRGSYAVIGRGHAVGIAFRRFKQSGFPAWAAWLLIHITFLIGFRSRLAVLLNWAYSYLTFAKSARIITGPTPRLDQLAPERALPDGKGAKSVELERGCRRPDHSYHWWWRDHDDDDDRDWDDD